MTGAGRDATETDDGRPVTRVGSFVSLTSGSWLVGGEACESPPADGRSAFCDDARASRWRGWEVLQGSGGEDRRYRPGGGYGGQGGGITRYAFLFGDRWVEFAATSLPEAIEDLGAAAPVNRHADSFARALARLLKSLARR